MKKDLLKLLDLTSEDILEILDTADRLKAMKKAGIPHPFLEGKTLAMIFEKSSTRKGSNRSTMLPLSQRMLLWQLMENRFIMSHIWRTSHRV